MTETAFLTLLLALCTQTNDRNYSHKELLMARLECMNTLTKCANKYRPNIEEFIQKCNKEVNKKYEK